VIHPTLLVAVHAQPDDVLILKLLLPPDAAKFRLTGLTEYEQLPAVSVCSVATSFPPA
jgi:hypothetical protein